MIKAILRTTVMNIYTRMEGEKRITCGNKEEFEFIVIMQILNS